MPSQSIQPPGSPALLRVLTLPASVEQSSTNAADVGTAAQVAVALPDARAIAESIETGKPLIDLLVVRSGPAAPLPGTLRTQLCRAALAGARWAVLEHVRPATDTTPTGEQLALETFCSTLGLMPAMPSPPGDHPPWGESEPPSSTDAQAQGSDHFEAVVEWLDERPSLVGRKLLLFLADQEATASISATHHILNLPENGSCPPRNLEHGDIGICTISLPRKLLIDEASRSTRLGRFVLRDQGTGHTVATGLVRHKQLHAQNIHRQALSVTRQDRERLNGTIGKVIWLTGLSGSGKSTVANALEQALFTAGYRTYILDGDNVRHGLNRDLGFSDADRVENIRRVAEVAKLMLDAGLIVITAFISPFRCDREMARNLIGPDDFFEIHISTPLETCERRDPKGLYRKARNGELPNLTGIGSPYEPPENPEMKIDTSTLSIEEAVKMILNRLDENLR